MTLAADGVAQLRGEFPALQRVEGGRTLAFLDGPGGTQVPRRVIDEVSDYYLSSNANSGGAFATSDASDRIVVEARAAVADLLGADNPDDVKLRRNMTGQTFHGRRSI